MRLSISCFLIAAFGSAVLTPIVRALAERRGLFDHAVSSRKLHVKAVPRLGGIAIVCAFYAPIVLLLRASGHDILMFTDPRRALVFLAGGAAIALLGFYDDLRGAGAREKFAVQVAVALFVYAHGFRMEPFELRAAGSFWLGALAMAVAVVWIAGVINAMNLIDGLDGLAGGVALCALGTNLVIAAARGDLLMSLAMASLAGAVLGFLVYNFNPASIFMGDGGSLFLGYVLAVSCLETHRRSPEAASFLAPAITLALPILDTLLAMSRRFLTGRSMFSGDKEHIHHRLLRLGLSHRQVVLSLYGACAVFGAAALMLTFAPPRPARWGLVALATLVLAGLRALGFFRPELAPAVVERRRRNRDLQMAVQSMAERLRQASSVAEVLRSVEDLGTAIEADDVRLHLEASGRHAAADLATGLGRWGQVEKDGAGAAVGPLRTRFPLDRKLGHLEVEWRDGRKEIDRDHELAAEALCKHIATALQRVSLPSGAGFAPAPLPVPVQDFTRSKVA